MTTTSTYDPRGRPRRLERSRDDRWLAGVCGGLGRYLGIDPVIVRLAFVAVTFAGGVGVIAYLAAFLLVPEEGNARPIIRTGGIPSSGRDRAWVIVGAVLLALGAIALLDALGRWWGGGVFWSLVLLGGGAFLLLRYTALGERFGVERAGRSTATAGPTTPAPPVPSPSSAASSPPETAFPGGSTAPGEAGPDDGEEAGPRAPDGVRAGDPLEPGTAATAPLPGGTPTAGLPGPVPTEELPHGGGPGDLRPGGPEMPPPVPPRRPHRPRATAVALGAVLLVVGLGGVLLAAGAYDVRLETFVAGAIVVTGLALVASAWFGGAPALIWLGLVTATVLGVLVAGNVHLNGGAGTRVYRPATAGAIKPTYQLGVGELWVDLRSTNLPPGITRVKGDVGIGDLTFVVPDGVDVQATGTSGAGEVRLFGRTQGGVDVGDTAVSPGRAGAASVRRVVIDGSAGLGEVRVYRASTAPSPPNGGGPGSNDQGRVGPPFGAGLPAITTPLGGLR